MCISSLEFLSKMDNSRQEQSNELEAEEENGQEPGLIFDGGKKGRFFIIDYGEYMFEDNGWRFRLVLQAIREQINKLACTGDLSELCSVIFVNASNTNDLAQKYECIFVHRELMTVDAEYVKGLDAILQNQDLYAALQPLLGDSGLCDWADLFYLCRRMFQYSGHVLRKKFINVFTTDTEEIENKEKIKTHIGNLQEIGTKVKVFLMEHEREESGITQFWGCIDPELSRFSTLDGLNESLHFKNYALRSSISLPFVIFEGLEFAVGLYHLIKPQGKPIAILMDSETNERVEHRTHFIPADTDSDTTGINTVSSTEIYERECFEGEVNFARNVGGVDVVLDREQLEKLRRFDRPGITVIGFKPLRLLKVSHRMSPAKYIYPLDNVIAGSSSVYYALFKRCLQRGLFILVRYTHKTNTPPQLCALVPQSGQSEEEKDLPRNYFYEGFHLLELPFAEEAREMRRRYETADEDTARWPQPNEEQVGVAREFVSKLTTQFSPDQFFNPVLQRHFKAIETVALDLDFEKFEKEADQLDILKPYFKNPANASRVSTELARMKGFCPPGEWESKPKKKRGGGGRQNIAKTQADEQGE